MLKTLWTTVLYQPIYNAFILLVSIMPNNDVGLAIILITVVIKIILFPLTQRMIDSQVKMNVIQPEIEKIKKEYPNKLEQAKATQELYKKHKVNPFSSCLPLIIQMIVLIALYQVFRGILNEVSVPSLYSFVTNPSKINMEFLGFIDLSAKKNLIFALLAGGTQFLQAKLMEKRQTKPSGEGMQAEIQRSMQTQMTYLMPVMMGGISYFFPAAVALYLITSNIFTVAQELYTIRKLRKNAGGTA